MDSFLRHTAKAIIARLNWQQLSRTTLVLPSHRAGLVLKNELLQLQRDQNQKAIWAPDVKTLQQLQDALSPLYTEDELMTIVRLYRIYRNNPDESNELLSLDQFYTWGRQMIADFTNVDASMHASEVDNFFDNTIAAHELSTWELEPEVEERLRSLFSTQINAAEKESIKAQYEVLWRNIHTFYTALRSEMEAEQKGYPGMRQRAVIERWEEPYIQEQIAGRTYVFVGFNYLLPVERELMTLLRDAGQALFFWDFVPDFETNTKAFSFAQQNSQILGRQDDSQSAQPTFPKPITVLYCVFKKGRYIGLEGLLNFGRCKGGNSPGLGKFQAAVPLKEVLQGEESPCLGEDLALQAPSFLGRRCKVTLCVLPEGIPALLFTL